MISFSTRCAMVLLLIGVLISLQSSMAPIFAHSDDTQVLAIKLNENELFINTFPLVTPFLFADDDGDTLLSAQEVETHREALIAKINENMTFVNEHGVPAERTLADVLMPGQEKTTNHLLFMLNYQWDSPPTAVDIHYSLSDELVRVLAQEEGKTTEIELTSSPLRLFGEGVAAPKQALWQIGINHVLEGYDHILFIVALVLATGTIGKLLLPLTTFTIAHTLTLAAVAMEIAPALPSWAVEATIAFSVAAIAGLHLAKPTSNLAHLWWFTGLIGLVHGLGFGQALTNSLGQLSEWVEALVSITIGVEITQIGIALIMLAILTLVTRHQQKDLVHRVIGIIIVCISLFWTVERILLA